MDSWSIDARVALRTLWKRPGFAAVAILTFALGIGATTSIFSVVHGVLLRSLPYRDAGALVEVRHRNPEVPSMDSNFSPQDAADVRAANVFAQQAEYMYSAGLTGVNVLAGERALRLDATYGSADFFDVLGVAALAGRAMTPADAEAKARVVVLSERVWRTQFNSDRALIGSTIRLDNEPFTVIGVMPARFQYPARSVDAWLPITLLDDDDVPHIRQVRWQHMIARLKPEQTMDAAQRTATAVVARLAEEYPDSNEGWTTAEVISLERAIAGDVRPALLLLLAAVALVLLIACANVANLVLVRATSRARELAVRSALGASRARVIRQLLTESVVLALIGGALGVIGAQAGVGALVALAGDRVPRIDEVGLNGVVLGFALLITVGTGLLAGLLPALRSSGRNLQSTLREGGRTGTEGRGRGRTRAALVVAEMALAVVLVIGAALMVRSFSRLLAVDPGFQPENMITFGATLQSELFEDLNTARRYRTALLERLGEVPGVVSVAAAKTLPLSGGGEGYGFMTRPGDEESTIRPAGGAIIVTPEYFRTLGIPVLRGREFLETDEPPAAPPLIVNEAFLRQYGDAATDPLEMGLYAGTTPLRIVGVVADVRHNGIGRPAEPTVYFTSAYAPRSSVKVFVRTRGDASAMLNEIERAVHAYDPALPIVDVNTMPAVVAESVAQPRFLTLLLALFGALALFLAALGMYGVIAYGVTQRLQEIGIRMALGARPASVLQLVVGQAAGLAGIGIAIGLAAAFALTRVMASLLFEVSATDPLVFALVPLFLFTVSLVAAAQPAMKALKVDPAKAFRE